MATHAIMSNKIWNIVTGNNEYMECSDQYPEQVIIPYLNKFMRGLISLIWLLLYGRSLRIEYNTGDVVYMKYSNWKYVSSAIFTHDGIMIGRVAGF